MKAGKARTHLRPSLQNTEALLTWAIFRVISHTLKKRAKPAPTSAPSLQNTKALLTRAIFRATFHVLV